MRNFPDSLKAKLRQREEANSLRILPVPDELVDFSSNDYLGFSRSTNISEAACQYLSTTNNKSNGATGSRLISGNHGLYQEAENYIAQFHQTESSLIFNSGYDANVGLFSSVPQRGDTILYDEYIHASIRDGIRLSNASAYKYRHNHMLDLEKQLKKVKNGQREIYVATESVFSMDGDSPDLERIISFCEQYGARVIVDEAHALGVRGAKGEGVVQAQGLQDKVFARIVTFGKGLGCHGAAVLGSTELKDYLINFARSFIYTTGLPPHSLATIRTAYKHLENSTYAMQALQKNINFFKREAERLGLDFIKSDSAIQCVIMSGNQKVKYCAWQLQQNGFNIKPILSPTVPQGQERLRFCIHAYNTEDQTTKALELLKSLLVQ